MPARLFTPRRLALVLAVVFIASNLLVKPAPTSQSPSAATASAPVLTQQRLQHITTGDRSGGGHLYGMNNPCKSEFPATWTTEKIARDIPQLAANDNLDWESSRNGYITAETTDNAGLRLRIVVDPDKNEIVTAYPVNVRRNPCDAANDN